MGVTDEVGIGVYWLVAIACGIILVQKPIFDSTFAIATAFVGAYGFLLGLDWAYFVANGECYSDLWRPNYILEESKKAENKINEFIKEVKKNYNLKNSQICLSGFSQGCMMSINLALTSNENYNCVVGFSGKIIDKKDLSKRKISSTKMLLMHGDMDTVVPPNNLLEAKDFMIRNNIQVETKMIKNCEHHIPIEASSSALNYIKNNFKV